MDKDLYKIITPDDISKFTNSQTARDAVKVLGKAARGVDTPVTRQYTLVRDYLMSDTIHRNANRPGVMKIKDAKEARLVNEHYIISVSRHKTSGVHEPAKIIMTKTLYSWLTIFTANILPQILIQSDLVFRSWTGEAVDVGRCFMWCEPVCQSTCVGCSSCSQTFCYPPFASIAKGEVFGLLYVCLFVRQRFLDNPRAD